jgi:hypothetical protein
MSSETLLKVVPIFIALMVWLVRLLIIGTFSLAGDRLFTTASQHQPYKTPYQQPQQTQRPYSAPQSQPRTTSYQAQRPVNQPINQPVLRPASQIARPAPKPTPSQQTSFVPPEPTYHPVSYTARGTESTSHYDA